jgi:hypothetical protein
MTKLFSLNFVNKYYSNFISILMNFYFKFQVILENM